MTSFVAVCIGIGALLTGIAAYLGVNFTQQLLVFAGFTFLSLFLIRPFAKRFIFKTKGYINTNADALLGKQATVCETIDFLKQSGRVKIDGDNWKAISYDGTPIPKGQIVTIVSLNSIVLTVK